MTEPAAAPAPAATRIPFVTDFGRIFRVLISPGEVFGEQQEKPTWFIPWVCITILVAVIGVFTLPYTDRMMELGAAARGATEVPASIKTFARVGALVGAPIAFLVLGAMSAGIMWVTLMLTGDKVRFRGLMCATIFAESTAMLQVLAQAVVLRLRGAPAEAIKNMQDARVSLGADLLLPADNTVGPFLRTIIGGIGPLQIWGLIITAVGIMVLEKQDKQSAWTAAIASYAVMLVVGGLLAGLGPS